MAYSEAALLFWSAVTSLRLQVLTDLLCYSGCISCWWKQSSVKHKL